MALVESHFTTTNDASLVLREPKSDVIASQQVGGMPPRTSDLEAPIMLLAGHKVRMLVVVGG